MRSRFRATFFAVSLLAAAVWPAAPGMGVHSPSRHGSGDATAPPSPDPASGGQAGSPSSTPKDPVAQCLQEKLNLERTSRGLSPLPDSIPLLRIAQGHSDLMASHESLHHTGPDIFQSLPVGWRAYGENVVYGRSCRQMFDAFMASDPHREAMLRPDFNFSAAAVSYAASGWIYATMVFADLLELPRPQPLPPVPDTPASATPPPQTPSPPAGPLPVIPAPEEALSIVAPPTIDLGPPFPAPETAAASSPGGRVQAAQAAMASRSDRRVREGSHEGPSGNSAGSPELDIFEKEPGFASGHRVAGPEIIFELDRHPPRPLPGPSRMA